MVFVPPWVDGLFAHGVPNVASVFRWILSIWFLGNHSRSFNIGSRQWRISGAWSTLSSAGVEGI
jgi:hypothetical protein